MHLGLLIEARGGMTVDCQIAQASKAFGELCNSVFLACDLSLETKCLVYQSVVLGVFLYGAETWAPKQVIVKKFETFHRCCVRCIMGKGNVMQWDQHITTI